MARGKLTVLKKTKGATVCRTKSGKKATLLTPSGKCKRYGRELKSGINNRTGEPLSEGAKGFRTGYRFALGEQAKIFNSKKGLKGKAKMDDPFEKNIDKGRSVDDFAGHGGWY